jgi:nucleotide-binding universal stress UspA family protein
MARRGGAKTLRRMYKRIIIGYDGSDQADDALAFAKQLASATQASLTALTVLQFDPIWGGRDLHPRDLDAELQRRLENAGGSVAVARETVEASSPARGLHEYAERSEADLVVLGSAHYGRVGQILAGSVAMSLLHGAPCAIAIAPLGYASRVSAGIEEIAIGYDAQRESRAALDDAIELARATVAPLKVVAVAAPAPAIYGDAVGSGQGWQDLRDAIKAGTQDRLDEAVASVPGDVRVSGVLAEGDPAQELARTAVADSGVLVVGSRAYGPLRRVLLGSVSTALVRSVPCPVIVRPRPAISAAPASEPDSAGTAA